MIDIICCFNDISDKTNWDGQKKGFKKCGSRRLSHVDQFIVLYHSIKKNWSFDYTIYLCHSLPISNKTHNRLKNLDIKLVQVESPDPQNYPYLLRSNSWRIKTQGTHKLYLDIDMVALKNPEFDLSMDFSVMPCNSNEYNGEGNLRSVIGLFKENTRNLKIKNNILTDMWANKMSVDEYRSGCYLPHFNGGAILMKNSLSEEFGKMWWDNFSSLSNKWQRGGKSQTPLLFSDGITILNMTEDYTIFNLGFNYFDGNSKFDMPTKDFTNNKNSISLYHYVQYHLLHERFGEYFEVLNEETK